MHHNRGSAVHCDVAAQEGKLDSAFAGAEYVGNVKTGTTKRALAARFVDEQVTRHLLIDAGEES